MDIVSCIKLYKQICYCSETHAGRRQGGITTKILKTLQLKDFTFYFLQKKQTQMNFVQKTIMR